MKGMIFIDGGNVFHSVKEYNAKHGTDVRIDFVKLSEFLTKQTKCTSLFRTHYYTGLPNNISDQQMGFLTKINLLPNFTVKTKPLKIKNNIPIEKGIDVMIVSDMLWCGIQKHCEHIILVSGDEDLTEAVKRLRDCGRRVTIAGFGDNTSKTIIKEADSYINLTEHIDKITKTKD